MTLLFAEYGSWQATNAYLNRYAEQFRLRERIRFNTRVVSIEKEDPTDASLPWTIRSERSDGSSEISHFAFVVVASGLFSRPYLPTIRDSEKFAGPIVHPCEVKTKEQLSEQRVLIIGTGKCATDMAVLAATYARSCHLVFRQAHWFLPRRLMSGLLPARYLLTRVSSVVFAPFPSAPHSRLFRFVHRTCPWLFTKITDQMSADILSTIGSDFYADGIFAPRTSMRNAENLMIMSENFVRLKYEGRIQPRLASIERIVDSTTIQLDSGEQLQADLLISATGFKLSFPFFSQDLCQSLGFPIEDAQTDMDLPLYRRLIPLRVPHLAFLGLTMNIAPWMLAEVSSHWVSDYFLGRLQLPVSEKDMIEEIQTERSFTQQTFNRHGYKLNYYWAPPIDTLLNDMGLAMHRTNNWIAEYFGVYRPERLRGLHEERQAKAQGRAIRRWYFGFNHTLLAIGLLIFLIKSIY